MSVIKVTELLGDGIGPELRESVYAVADALPIEFEFIPFDLSLENRESGDRDLAHLAFDDEAESRRQKSIQDDAVDIAGVVGHDDGFAVREIFQSPDGH